MIEQKILQLTELMNSSSRNAGSVLLIFYDIFQITNQCRDLPPVTTEWLSETASTFLSPDLLKVLIKLRLEIYAFHFAALNFLDIDDVIDDLYNDKLLKGSQFFPPGAYNKLKRELLGPIQQQNSFNESIMKSASTVSFGMTPTSNGAVTGIKFGMSSTPTTTPLIFGPVSSASSGNNLFSLPASVPGGFNLPSTASSATDIAPPTTKFTFSLSLPPSSTSSSTDAVVTKAPFNFFSPPKLAVDHPKTNDEKVISEVELAQDMFALKFKTNNQAQKCENVFKAAQSKTPTITEPGEASKSVPSTATKSLTEIILPKKTIKPGALSLPKPAEKIAATPAFSFVPSQSGFNFNSSATTPSVASSTVQVSMLPAL